MTRPLQVGILSSDREYEPVAAAFRSVAAPVERLTPESALVALSAETTLVVVSKEAAARLDPAVRSGPRGANASGRKTPTLCNSSSTGGGSGRPAFTKSFLKLSPRRVRRELSL